MGPPVPCARARVYATAAGIRSSTPAKTKNYEKHVGLLALAARPRDWPLTEKAYGLRVTVYRAARQGDADNFLKSCADGLKGIAWKDDARVFRMAVEMADDSERPRAHITVELLAELRSA
jgi:Holliday junction resolvase RusA-like endonuclease